MAKPESVREKNDATLRSFIEEQERLLYSFRVGTAGSKTKNVKEGRSIRKRVARGLTEERARKENI